MICHWGNKRKKQAITLLIGLFILKHFGFWFSKFIFFRNEMLQKLFSLIAV